MHLDEDETGGGDVDGMDQEETGRSWEEELLAGINVPAAPAPCCSDCSPVGRTTRSHQGHGDSAPAPVKKRVYKRDQRLKEIKSSDGPNTRGKTEELEALERKRPEVPAKEFAKGSFSTIDGVIMHDKFLAEDGKVGKSASMHDRSVKITEHIEEIWKKHKVATRSTRSIRDKVKNTLKLRQSHRGKRGKSDCLVPNGNQLFDIVKCRCFPSGLTKSQCLQRECICEAALSGDALKFYLDQRFDRVVWWEPEADPPTAEEEKEYEKEAAKEDAHMENVAAEHPEVNQQANVQEEEDAQDARLPDLDSDEENSNQPVPKNQDGSAGDSNSTATHQGGGIEEEQKPSIIEGPSAADEVELTASPAPNSRPAKFMKWSVREDSPDLFADDDDDDAAVETEKKKKADPDWKPADKIPLSQLSNNTGPSSSQLSGENPASQRCMIDLEAASAMVSRYRLSNAAAAAVLTAGYEDKDGRVRAHTIIGPHNVFYARQKYGNQRTSARLETATEAAGWYWDERKDLTRTNTKVETKVWTPGDEDNIEVTSAKGVIREEHAVMIAFKPEKDPVTSKIWTRETYIKTLSFTKEEGKAIHATFQSREGSKLTLSQMV